MLRLLLPLLALESQGAPPVRRGVAERALARVPRTGQPRLTSSPQSLGSRGTALTKRGVADLAEARSDELGQCRPVMAVEDTIGEVCRGLVPRHRACP